MVPARVLADWRSVSFSTVDREGGATRLTLLLATEAVTEPNATGIPDEYDDADRDRAKAERWNQ